MTSEVLRVHGGAEVSASGGSSALLDRGVRTDVAPKAVAQGMLLARLVLTVERLERTNRELDEFARLTAHDLSAPLLALSRLVELLPANDGTDQAATLAAIRSSVDRMSAMVDGVLGYAGASDAVPGRGTVDLADVLDRVLETLSVEITSRSATVTSGALPAVHGDEHQLERVLLNLVANALKYGGTGSPRVHIAASREPRAWRISISDEGIGVQPTDRTRIFELFARGETAVNGWGIGLAVSHRIVEQHGGRLWVEPNDPCGSTFHFTLPDDPMPASASAAAAAEDRLHGLGVEDVGGGGPTPPGRRHR